MASASTHTPVLKLEFGIAGGPQRFLRLLNFSLRTHSKRFGQTRPIVDMLNLVYEGTVDQIIYERLSDRMRDRFDLFGSLPDTIEDTWIENIETLDEKLDDYINAQGRVNGFDIRYNTDLDADEDEWRNCAKVLSRRSIDTLMRQGW